MKTLVADNTALALDLYQKFWTAPGNVFFSPFGISTGLGLVYGGARGGTERELGHAAHYGGDLGTVVILPEAVDGLAEIENALTAESTANETKRNIRVECMIRDSVHLTFFL